MAEPIPDLLPDDFGPAEGESPVTILRAQADLLAAKTNGVVQGEVQRLVSSSQAFGFNFVVPALEDYRYQAFQISYPLADGYPLELSGAVLGDKEIRVENRQQYLDQLRQVFSSPAFARVLRSIIREASAVQA
jgi:hypothetical protein